MGNRAGAAALLAGLTLGVAGTAADIPQAQLNNGQLKVTINLPDRDRGFYRGTRFDWSGVIEEVEHRGHSYYGRWFQKTDAGVHDFEYRGAEIVAGPCTAITGPAEEFTAQGYEEAKPGGTFVKIGVGALRKAGDGGKYDNFHLYEMANPGRWSVRKGAGFVEFTHELRDAASGYAYLYRKVVRLTPGKPELAIEHSLKNTGQRPLKGSVYNHNFLFLDHQAPGPEVVITVPFQIVTERAATTGIAEVRGNQIVYLKMLEGEDRVHTVFSGFGNTAKDYDFRVENRKTGSGMRVTGDRPLVREALWSIRAVLSMEPFIAIDVAPGAEFTWKLVYEYYAGTR
jgi:hypothetical protein